MFVSLPLLLPSPSPPPHISAANRTLQTLGLTRLPNNSVVMQRETNGTAFVFASATRFCCLRFDQQTYTQTHKSCPHNEQNLRLCTHFGQQPTPLCMTIRWGWLVLSLRATGGRFFRYRSLQSLVERNSLRSSSRTMGVTTHFIASDHTKHEINFSLPRLLH